MSRFARLLGLSLLLPAAAANAQPNASTVSIHLTASSDFIQYGLSQTDGNAALRAGVDYQHQSGFIAGAWLANAEYAGERGFDGARDLMASYYAGVGRSRGSWAWSALLSAYDYPGAGIDYDYTTVGGSVSWRRRIVYSASYGRRFYGRDVSVLDQEVTGYWPLRWNMALSATLGRFASDAPLWTDDTYWNIGLSKVVHRFSVDVRLHDTSYDFYSWLGKPAEKRWVASLSAGFDL
jgi:uncharacterized protein (TIGR02001 family)